MLTKRRIQSLLAGATAFLAVAAVAMPSASASGDTTPPVIKTNTNAGFVVGSTISATNYTDDDWSNDYASVQEYINYTVTDNSGRICDFKVNTITEEGWENLVAEPVQSYQPTPYTAQFVGWNDTYWGQIGDTEDSQAGWTLSANDCGNATTVMVPNKPAVIEENNYSNAVGEDGSISYAGTWSNVSCACASGGSMRRTSAKGASFTFTDYWHRDDHAGLVMAQGPSRGSADVYVDGKKVATVNTYSATNQNRVIVFDRWMSEGTHTIKVVNLATSGHPRIDLDAALNN